MAGLPSNSRERVGILPADGLSYPEAPIEWLEDTEALLAWPI